LAYTHWNITIVRILLSSTSPSARDIKSNKCKTGELENVSVKEMPKKPGSKTRKRIYNPWTRSYYAIRQRSSVKGARGTIKGKWKPPKKKKKRS